MLLAAKIDAGDTAWVLAASALVLFMTPGLAFFYGGMVRGKNVLGMLMQNVFCMGLVSVLWAFVAFSLAFGKDHHAMAMRQHDLTRPKLGQRASSRMQILLAGQRVRFHAVHL